jgi:proline iminopeptidase
MPTCIARVICLRIGWILIAACADQPVESPPHAREGYIESGDGVALYWRTLGIAGDTLVVLHGGPFVDHAYLVPDLEPLAQTHVLIFYDQRGTGRSTLVSDPASLHLDAHIADLEAVRQHFGLSRMVLLGHSWGPLLGAAYALEHSEKLSALIAVSPAPLRRQPYWDQVFPRVTAWMDSTALMELGARDAARRDTTHDARAACRALFELYVRGALADPMDVDMAQRIAAGFCSAPATAIRNQMLVDSLTMGSLGDYDWRERFRDTRFPVLVVAGEKDVDPVEAYQEWLHAFPDARLTVLESTGHFPYLERPEDFFGVVAQFLREHGAAVRRATGGSG